MPSVLLVLSSHPAPGSATPGWSLPQAARVWHRLGSADCEVDFCTMAGGPSPSPGTQDNGDDGGDPARSAFVTDPDVREDLEDTPRPDQVNPDDYDALILIGGPGAAWDFPDSEELQVLCGAVYDNGGVLGAIGEGVAGLLNLREVNDGLLIEGRQIAAPSAEEERAHPTAAQPPVLISDGLRERGAVHRPAEPGREQVAVDERLVTGQNTASAVDVADAVLALLADMG